MQKLLHNSSRIYSLLFLMILFTIPIAATEKPLAINGKLDLSEWSFEKDGVVSIDGQWEFYWKELLTPAEIVENKSILNTELITVPMAWNKYVKSTAKNFAGDGYATYRLQITIPENLELALKIPRIFTSYRLWINGEVVASNGIVATTKNEMVPQYLPTVKFLKPETDHLELVIQVANFRHRSGGILESLTLGLEKQISQIHTKNLALELFLFGSLLLMGLYHLGLFAFRTKDRSSLYFGVYALLVALRTVLVGEIYLIYLFPNFSWEIAHKIQTSAYYLGTPLVVLFLKSIFPQDISTLTTRIVSTIALAFEALVLLTPARIFTIVNPFYQIFSVFVIGYLLTAVIKVCVRKREGSYLIAIGSIIFFLCAINDILFLSVVVNDARDIFLKYIIRRGNLSSIGLLALTFAQSLVLAKKFANSFNKIEVMSQKLTQLNESLEDKVTERTHELEKSKLELEKALQSVSQLETSRQQLLQNISHDLRTPLTSVQGFVGAILDGIINNPDQQKKYLKRVLEKVSSINIMVEQLFELSRLENGKTNLEFCEISLNAFVKSTLERYTLDFKSINRFFHKPGLLMLEELIADNLFINIDPKGLDRVFNNLFSNALAHTPQDGRISLNFSLSKDKKELIIEIADTGTGVPPESLPFIFERFYKVERSRQTKTQSNGLGLAICKEIVEHHGGRIWVVSKLHEGSNFFFTLPIIVKEHSSTKQKII